jgi:hypothetical protein
MNHPRPGSDNPVKPEFPSLMHRVAIIHDVPSSVGLRLRPRHHVASGRLSQVRHPFAFVPPGAVGGRLCRSETQGLETNSAWREHVGGELPHISTTIGTTLVTPWTTGHIDRCVEQPADMQYILESRGPNLTLVAWMNSGRDFDV